MTTTFDVAVVGATGVVGAAMLEILADRKFPVGKVHALASERSVGKKVEFGNRELVVSDLAEFDFSSVQIGLFSAGGSISAEFAPKAAAAGCVVIDNTSRFRYEDEIPLVVPEVNPGAIAGYKKKHGDVMFCVETLRHEELPAALLDSRIDIGLAFDPDNMPGIRGEVLGEGRSGEQTERQ